MGVVPPLPVWGISMQGCLDSQWDQHTEYIQFGTSKEPRCDGEKDVKEMASLQSQPTKQGPPPAPSTSYRSDKEKMPSPEHGSL